jgi:hypothetical protein
MATKTFCDRCGREVDRVGLHRFQIWSYTTYRLFSETDRGVNYYELCEDCVATVEKCLAGEATEAVKE